MSDLDAEVSLLSPAAEALMEQWLRRPDALRPPAPVEPNEARLVPYLCGALPLDEARRLEQGLTASGAARRRLRAARETLRRLQSAAWSEVKREAEAGDPTAQAWLALASERTGLMARAIIGWRDRPWTELRRRAAEGLAEAQTALAALLAFGEQLRLEFETRGAIAATVKGAAQDLSSVEGDLPSSVSSEVTAGIGEDGALHASLILMESLTGMPAKLSGQVASLALRLNDRIWPMGEAIVSDGRAEWQTPEVGVTLELPAGRLPRQYLWAVVGGTAAPPPAEGHVLLASILDASGEPEPGHVVRIELRGEPQWREDRLEATLVLDPIARIAYAAYDLTLDIAVAPHHWQRLGAWPVSTWEDAPRTLTTPCPGGSETAAEIGLGLPLRIRLQPK